MPYRIDHRPCDVVLAQRLCNQRHCSCRGKHTFHVNQRRSLSSNMFARNNYPSSPHRHPHPRRRRRFASAQSPSASHEYHKHPSYSEQSKPSSQSWRNSHAQRSPSGRLRDPYRLMVSVLIAPVSGDSGVCADSLTPRLSCLSRQ